MDLDLVYYADACERLKALQTNGDIEGRHVRADEILLEVLLHLGCTEIIELWDNFEKWYA